MKAAAKLKVSQLSPLLNLNKEERRQVRIMTMMMIRRRRRRRRKRVRMMWMRRIKDESAVVWCFS